MLEKAIAVVYFETQYVWSASLKLTFTAQYHSRTQHHNLYLEEKLIVQATKNEMCQFYQKHNISNLKKKKKSPCDNSLMLYSSLAVEIVILHNICMYITHLILQQDSNTTFYQFIHVSGSQFSTQIQATDTTPHQLQDLPTHIKKEDNKLLAI